VERLLAARRAAATWDIRTKGLADPAARRLRIYASAETHTWIQKAADLAGLPGGRAVRVRSASGADRRRRADCRRVRMRPAA
jgi:glutamate/tyrosine decarboxylase-like PLP-dependent enzyme